MTNFTIDEMDFTDLDARKEFITNTESNLFTGKNVNGQEVIVGVDKGVGMTVKTLNGKGWYEGVGYGSDGYRDDEFLEKAK